MENSWRRKCDIMWQSTFAPVVSSSQESQNEILNSGYNFHSCIQAKPISPAHRMAPESLLPWISSMSSNSLDHAELGRSLLPLLSGPQCVTPAELPPGSCNVGGFAAGNEFSVSTSGVVSQNLSSQNVEAGYGPSSVLSLKARVSANHGNKSGPSNVLPDAYINLEKLELPKAGMHQNVFSNETEVLFPSLRVGCVNSSIPSNDWKIPNGYNTGAIHKPEPSLFYSASTVTTGWPRVFCLNLSGDLLLSNTGLLGVVCSCHGIHMSITRFSEHSGLSNMNPGVAVRLHSGETIAQWRKVYFHRYGIKIPEDHCGWDWPEGLLTAGSLKHSPLIPGVCKNFDHCSQEGSLAAVQSFNLQNSTVFPGNFHTVQKLPDQFAHNEKHRNAKECVSSSLKNNLHSVAQNQKMMYSTSESSTMSSFSTMSNLVGVKGPDNACQPLPSYILPISKSGDPFVLHPHVQNLETIGKDIDIGRNSGSSVQRDISSNFELRLGQPSQQGQSSGGSIQLAFGSHIIGTPREPQNTFFLEQHVPRSYSKSVEVGRQHNYSDNSVPSSCQTEQVKGAAGGSLISRSAAHLKYPLDGRIHSKSMSDVTRSSHVAASKVHFESPSAKLGQHGFPFVGGEASERGFISNSPCSREHEICENGATDRLQGAAELSFCSQSKGRIWSFGGGEIGSDHKLYTVGKDESTAMCHFSGGMTDEPVGGNTLNYFDKALYPPGNGEFTFSASRSHHSPMDFRRVLSTQVVPLGFSARNSLGGGPNLMDKNVRVSAVQHMSELSNQNHYTTSFNVIPEQDIRNFCRKTQDDIPLSASDKQIGEIMYVSMPKTSEVAMQSFQSANLLSSDNMKLPSVTEKACNFSMPSQGRYCQGNDAESQCQFTLDMQSTRQLMLRLGGTESNSPSSRAGKCSQRIPVGCFPGKYSFSVQTNSLTGIYDEKGETILPQSKDEGGHAGNVMATLLGQKLGKSSSLTENVDSFCHNEHTKQNTKKAECNSFLWRDVPGKVVEKCNLDCFENSVDSFNGNVVQKARKCLDATANSAGPFKEQEMSNVSSGCSAPVVTQASMEVNNKDSSTVDAEDVLYKGNAVVDESSGIERCWSSDDGVDSERNAKASVFDSELNLGHRRPLRPLARGSNCSLIDELRFRESSRLKMQKQSHTSNCSQEKGTLVQKSARDYKIWKRRPVKWKKLTSSFSPSALSVLHNGSLECDGNADLCSPKIKDVKMLRHFDPGNFEACPCAAGGNNKQKSTPSLSTDISLDRSIFRHHVGESITDGEMILNTNSDNMEAMGEKCLRLSVANQALKPIHLHRSSSVDMEVAVKGTSTNCHSSEARNISQKPRRPIVCGKYGVIANANSLKPAKIVSLRKLLKAPSKLPNTSKVDLSSGELSKKPTIKGRNGPFYKSSKIREAVNGNLHHAMQFEANPQHCLDEMKTECSTGSKQYDNLSHLTKRRRCHGNKIEATSDGCQTIKLRPKYKEVRKRSLLELTTKETHSSYMKFPILKNVKSIPQMTSIFPRKLVAEADKTCAKEICNDKLSSKDDECHCASDLDVRCCVCGSSSKDANHNLLECSGCLIEVNEGRDGVSGVPKAHWYCRSCKTSSNKIGLSQSKLKGEDNDNEGIDFYERYLLHAMNCHYEPDSYHLHSSKADDGQNEFTCARTEGYKGRKQDGVHYNLPRRYGGCGGSLVPQEQLDAWIHINRQKPRRKGPLKLSSSEIEHDCRKEYARYKQSRGWEHLVVYKSAIHGLGLYTSQFISRGSMVVEYVGEIVGLRVADNRETEYQSGKKLQYKSACYFFRIDKEYIIDATRKGGIARFVNHSCQPNCVAEIISVRNEKKVVFFAERDIYPGEEITYDYHFNHEDEGKKIPCYCHSKNCRRYLN